jgi:hypothetical protein
MLRDSRRTGEARVRDAVVDLPASRKGAAKVSRDMEYIFGSANLIVPIEKPRGPDAVVQIVGNESGSWRGWLIGGIILALLGLITAGGATWFSLTSQLTHPAKAVVTHIATQPLPTFAPRQVEPRAAAAAVTPAVPPAMVPARTAPSATNSFRAERGVDQPPGVRIAEVGTANECMSTGEKRLRAGCMHPDILAADEELRNAYARASASGVNAHLLSRFRDRWWQVRKDAASDPDYATKAYRQLARELDIARSNG